MKKSIFKSLLIFSLFLIIPIISIITSDFLLEGMNTNFVNRLSGELAKHGNILAENVNIYTVCHGEFGTELKDNFKRQCSDVEVLQDISFWALMSVLLAATTIISILVFAFISHAHHIVLLWSMRLCKFLVTIFASVLILSQSILLVVTLLMAEAYLTGYVTPRIVAPIAVIAFCATIALFKSLFIAFNRKHIVYGIKVNENTQKKLCMLINSIAKKVGTKAPKNIIIGLGTSYFVTQSKIVCFSGKARGRTIFVSLSLLEFLTLNELEAILAHEMGHFKGRDTIYSAKIAPMFERIFCVIQELNRLNSCLVYPIKALIYFFVSIFELKNADFNRKREYRADNIGAKVSSSRVFANALAKVTFFGQFWKDVEQRSYELLLKGKRLKNKDVYFRSYMDTDSLDENKIMQNIMSFEISHPRDSHPSLQERFKNLNIRDHEINLFLNKNEQKASIIIDDLLNIEENLSALEQHLLYDRIKSRTASSLVTI